jgi:alanine-glyoxylate transaminase/serine-glyoxylate transaminase/serine-pyruvate transaminase
MSDRTQPAGDGQTRVSPVGATPAGANQVRPRRGREFLHTPGPTNIPDRILNAMHRPAVDFSGPDFIALAMTCFADLKPLFGTAGEVFIYTSSGHGGWEASIVNLLEAGDTILAPEVGRFSRGWAAMAEAHGVSLEVIPSDWRHAIDPDAVADRLRADTAGKIKAVLAVHVETATGVVSDIPAIRAAIDAAGHPALLVVDAIASLGTVTLPMDDWGVDVVVAASQKGLMMPPGLGFTAAGPKALEASAACGTPREYWSWQARSGPEFYSRFCGTAPEHMIFALRATIDMLNEEGLGNVFARHARLAEAVRRAVAAWGAGGPLDFNAVVPEQRAQSLTVVRTPEDLDGELIRTVAREQFGVSIGGGQALLKGRAFRIGHMGDLNEPMILGALGGIEAALRTCSVAHDSGLEAAVTYLAETAAD